MNNSNQNYKVTDFLPLIIIFSLIILIVLLHQAYFGWHIKSAMHIFMASFFIIFGLFKIINLAGFAQAYNMYDIIAKKYFAYGYVYPFIELSLGLAYLINWNPFLTNIATVILMSVSAIGVFIELRKGKKIMCACLGVVFKVPMTYVTLMEDLLMALMALIMLIKN